MHGPVCICTHFSYICGGRPYMWFCMHSNKYRKKISGRKAPRVPAAVHQMGNEKNKIACKGCNPSKHTIFNLFSHRGEHMLPYICASTDAARSMQRVLYPAHKESESRRDLGQEERSGSRGESKLGTSGSIKFHPFFLTIVTTLVTYIIYP